jgi:hypothetical protein
MLLTPLPGFSSIFLHIHSLVLCMSAVDLDTAGSPDLLAYLIVAG